MVHERSHEPPCSRETSLARDHPHSHHARVDVALRLPLLPERDGYLPLLLLGDALGRAGRM